MKNCGITLEDKEGEIRLEVDKITCPSNEWHNIPFCFAECAVQRIFLDPCKDIDTVVTAGQICPRQVFFSSNE